MSALEAQDSAGASAHGEGCLCQRCRGFEPGNQAALKYGAHSTLALKPRAEKLAHELREAMGARYAPDFELAVATTAMIGARFEAALGKLLDSDDARDVEWLDLRAHRWARLWTGGLDRLGLSPLAASKLGLNIALGRGADLKAHLAANYGGDGSAEGEPT
jgi:hypothetical protein